jgi:hypothetical protein
VRFGFQQGKASAASGTKEICDIRAPEMLTERKSVIVTDYLGETSSFHSSRSRCLGPLVDLNSRLNFPTRILCASRL